jgi:hypothetical protein
MAEILRPMSTGELMDCTLRLYKKNFKLFVGIASFGPATYLVFQLLTIRSASLPAGNATRVDPFSSLSTGFGFLVGFLIMLGGMAIAHAATVRAVAAVHLGLPIKILDAYKSLKGRIWRVLGVFTCMGLLAAFAAVVAIVLIVILMLVVRTLFVGTGETVAGREAAILGAFFGFGVAVVVFVFALIVWVRYALAIACCVVEDLGVVRSIKRSAALSRGSRFRIFLIYTVFLILAAVVGAAFGGLAGGVGTLIPYVPARFILLYVAGFIAGLLTGPLATIGIALAYYDERVRKEAFDLQLMMNSLESSPAPVDGVAPVQP